MLRSLMTTFHNQSEYSEIQQKYAEMHASINQKLKTCLVNKTPESLYAPGRYILEGKGKRIRPVLVLLGAESILGHYDNLLDLALSVEVLHNFTLIHDDIMDRADLRHGRDTVHKKWNDNIGILSGDMMLAFAYELALLRPLKNLHQILSIITQSTITICEGQTLDLDFETRHDVTISEYLDMISKKTGRLIAASLEIGGLAAEASPEQFKSLSKFGELIGQAFQIQDDLLDIMADDKKFGKVPGGDVMTGKKTFLLLRAIELSSGEDRDILQKIVDNHGTTQDNVPKVKAIYERCGVLTEAKDMINKNFDESKELANQLPSSQGRKALIDFAAMIMKRES